MRTLRPAFTAVELASYRRGAVPTIAYNRLNRHYRPAVELARLIIESSSLELRHGEVTGAAFMIDMNAVFERFLRAALREALHLPERQWPEGERERRLTLDEAGRVRLFPDLMWRSGPMREPIFVGDAKYKRIVPSGWPNADIYQMLAYCTAADLLVRPPGLRGRGERHGVPPSQARRQNDRGGMTLDLTGTPDEMLAAVGELASTVTAHRRHALDACRIRRRRSSAPSTRQPRAHVR